ncbi:hypothetical protein Cadr_000014924 [Camelus dromedarius]|uniref:Uncharacterized protein n=1 Tax=Camelus dromedarius TaxID=9838 RepID=A0A5N4DMJ1_CAMDR|nr:hypothetical protein Cadr_000014924 [Camelus dromedarius]KAB1272269.1 hypothetical protein Cadr_000014924 [Camelus dromedarius]
MRDYPGAVGYHAARHDLLLECTTTTTLALKVKPGMPDAGFLLLPEQVPPEHACAQGLLQMLKATTPSRCLSSPPSPAQAPGPAKKGK